MSEQNLNDLFRKYLDGNLNATEKDQFLQIIRQHSAEELNDLMLEVWQNSAHTDGRVDDAGLTRISAIMKRIGNDEPKRKRIIQWPWLAAAASILVFIGLAGLWYMRSQHETVAHQIFASRGQKKQVTLPDSSVVYLNGGTSITYTNEFNDELREVALNGEAYFEVAKNKQKPFIIHTGQLDVKVVGTTFNVSSYGKNEAFKVTVSSGKVKVAFGKGSKQKYFAEQTLTRGQQLIFTNKNQLIVNKGIDVGPALSWKEGMLVFHSNTLPEVAARLERWYNIQIEVKVPNADKIRLNGKFENLSLNDVLDILKLTGNFDYKKVGDHIVIANK